MQVAEFTYNSATFLNLNKDIFYLLDCLLLFTLLVYQFSWCGHQSVHSNPVESIVVIITLHTYFYTHISIWMFKTLPYRIIPQLFLTW